jgi:AcrR family transcriptional regulator
MNRRYASPLRDDQKDRTRALLLDAAAAEIAEKGRATVDVDVLTLPAVARRAGVAVRTLYRYFPTKRALQDAYAARMVAASGWGDGPRTPDEVPALFERTYAAMPATTKRGKRSAALEANRRARYASLSRALAPAVDGLDDVGRRAIPGLMQALGSVEVVGKLQLYWDLDGAQSGQAIGWAMRTLLAALDEGRETPWGRTAGKRRRARGRKESAT